LFIRPRCASELNPPLFSTATLIAAVPVFGATVTPSQDSSALVNNLLGTGITLVGSPSLQGAAGSAGFFTNGLAAGLGIGSGIILSTGEATLASGSNDGPDTGDDVGPLEEFGSAISQDGFAPLETFNGNQTTFDATVLSFDFTSDGGDLFFNYVFASDEYPEFVDGDVNDVFAFLLDGENIALIPGSQDFVSIDTVNAEDNAGFFVANANQTETVEDPDAFEFGLNIFEQDIPGTSPLNLEFDGLTTVLTASALNLTPGEHTISLAIADSGDSILDSAVFLQASTFADVVLPPTPNPDVVPTPSAAVAGLLGLSGLSGLMARRRRG